MIGIFEKYLTIWVALCIISGTLIGNWIPAIPKFLGETLTVYEVNIPIGLLLFGMIYPMLLKIDFKSVKGIMEHKKAILITLITNWLLAPFSMFLWSKLFFESIFSTFLTDTEQTGYLAGAILLGVAPCTAMVFLWSVLTKGCPTYTLIQVAVNDVILIFAFAPIATFLLNVSSIPFQVRTILVSVGLFVVLPFFCAVVTRMILLRRPGGEKKVEAFIKFGGNFSMVALLSTLVLIFVFQGDAILTNPLHILLIAVPYTIHTVIIFIIPFFTSVFFKVPFKYTGPSSMIAASNFFELAVASAMVIYGPESPAVLATVVGVLTEVPIMLSLCKFINWYRVRVEGPDEEVKPAQEERRK
ncbi:hypothetical protein P9112_013940 [Eukaryota sp. TZLM1-RC]